MDLFHHALVRSSDVREIDRIRVSTVPHPCRTDEKLEREGTKLERRNGAKEVATQPSRVYPRDRVGRCRTLKSLLGTGPRPSLLPESLLQRDIPSNSQLASEHVQVFFLDPVDLPTTAALCCTSALRQRNLHLQNPSNTAGGFFHTN